MTIKGVDLLPAEKKKITLDPLIFILVIITIFSVGVFWFLGKQYEKKIAEYKTKISEVDLQIKDIESKIPEVDNIKKEIALLEAQLVAIEEKKRDPQKYKNLLKEIATIIPKNLYLTRMDIEPSSNKISLSGVSVVMPAVPPLGSIANFIKNFQASNIFYNVNLGSASQAKTEGGLTYTFNLDVNFNPEKAAEIDRVKLLQEGGAPR